jgi:hypothetical protein
MPLRAIQKTVSRDLEGFVKDKLGIKDKSKNAFGPGGTLLSYPEDLFDPSGKYGQNYTLFNIILDAEDRVVKEGGAYVTAAPGRVNVLNKVAGATNVSTGTLGAATGAVIGGIGGALGGFLGKGGLVGGVLGLFGGKKASEVAMSGNKVSLDAMIALYTPNDIQVSYATQFEEGSYATFDNVVNLAVNAVGNMKQAVEGSRKLPTAARNIGDLTSTVVATELNRVNAIQRQTRTPFNPKIEQLFKGVDIRTFNLTYSFSPKTQAEAQAVIDIIYTFKRFMMPDTVLGENLYTYPAEFEITHCKGSEANPNLFKARNCILTNMTTNYTPHAIYATFEDGIPVSINMTLSFKETRALVRKDIEEGL